jgi:hypothetical protein
MKILEWFLGVSLAFSMFVGIYLGIDLYKSSIPLTDYFEPQSIIVPDFIVGENPNIVYERVIKKDAEGSWIAEVQTITKSGIRAVCAGTGKSLYQPEKVLPPNGIDIEWLIGGDCELESGTYRIEIKWTFEIEGIGGRTITLISNVFKVTEKTE